MSLITKAFMALLCVNIVCVLLYPAAFGTENLPLGTMFNDDYTGVTGDLTNATPTSLQTAQASGDTGGFSLVDSIKMVWGFLLLLLQFLIAPLMIMISLSVPTIFIALIGVPLVALYLLGIIALIRGVSG